MDMQKLVEQVAQQAQDLADLKAERQREEMLDFIIKIITAQYTNAKAYTNVVIIAGYVGFFAMWGFVRADMPKSATFWALLLMAFSATMFVLFEVYKMIWAAWSVRRYIFAAEDGADPLEKFRQLEKTEMREAQVIGKVWLFALILTIPPGVAALAVLTVNVLLLLINQR